MSAVDLNCKGITWVGNLYQKFEAICLEVEDIVCEETTKIVENQVQSVGVSVKKFYAELVQDLLPPSSEDPEKPKEGIDENPTEEPPLAKELEAVAPDGKDLSYGSSFRISPNTSHLPAPPSEDPFKGTGTDLSIEQNEISLVIHGKLKFGFEEFTEEDEVISPKVLDVIASPANGMSGASLLTGLHRENENNDKICRAIATLPRHSPHLSSEDPIKGTVANLSLEQNENSSVVQGKLKFGAGEFTEEDELSSSKVLEVISLPGNDLSGSSLLTGLHNENNGKICNAIATVPSVPSVDVGQCNSTRGAGKICFEISDAMGCISDAMGCISDVSSASSASLILPASYFENEAGAGPTPPRGIPAVELNDNSKTCTINGQKHYDDCAEIDVILPPSDNGRSDGYNADEMAKGNYAGRSDDGTINGCHGVKLEESCILVDCDELHLVSHRTGKNRSYKKKLRDVFSLRTRSRKKQEYEQLAPLCGNVDTTTSSQGSGSSQIFTLTGDLDSKKSSIHDCFDSEWELL